MAHSGSREFEYATDEQTQGYVRVILSYKGLRTKQKFLPKFETVADNATIAPPTYGNRSLYFQAVGTKNIKGQDHHMNIKQLPGEIVPEDCYYKVEKDRIVLFLKKCDETPWPLDSGLETDLA